MIGLVGQIGCYHAEGRTRGHAPPERRYQASRAEIVLTVDGELGDEQPELVGAIADTRAMFEGKGSE